MKRKIKILITAFLIVTLIFIAIFAVSLGKRQEVKNLIHTYNSVLQQSYLELKAPLMEQFTSERELKKIDSYIMYLYKNGKMFKGELKDLKFIDIKMQDHSATVTTEERWIYTYIDPSSKKPVSDTFDEIYGNTYSLMKIDGHWVVDNLTSKKLRDVKNN